MEISLWLVSAGGHPSNSDSHIWLYSKSTTTDSPTVYNKCQRTKQYNLWQSDRTCPNRVISVGLTRTIVKCKTVHALYAQLKFSHAYRSMGPNGIQKQSHLRSGIRFGRFVEWMFSNLFDGQTKQCPRIVCVNERLLNDRMRPKNSMQSAFHEIIFCVTVKTRRKWNN